jgi:hypothetical protein
MFGPATGWCERLSPSVAQDIDETSGGYVARTDENPSRIRGASGSAASERTMTSNRIDGLIAACRDDQRTLTYESRFVDDQRRVVLTRLAAERGEFVERLRDRRTPRVDSRATGSWKESLREFGRSVRVLAGGANSGDAIAECRRSRSRTEARYERALELKWPGEILPLLLEQVNSIRQAQGELIALQF